MYMSMMMIIHELLMNMRKSIMNMFIILRVLDTFGSF